MFVLNNRHASELSGGNCQAKISHLKQLMKNIQPAMSALENICSIFVDQGVKVVIIT